MISNDDDDDDPKPFSKYNAKKIWKSPNFDYLLDILGVLTSLLLPYVFVLSEKSFSLFIMYLFYACVEEEEKNIYAHAHTNSKQWTKLSSLSNFKCVSVSLFTRPL